MIDTALLKRLLVLSAILLGAAAGAAALLGAPLPFAGGLLLGLVLGAVPFASWGWIALHGLSSRRARLLAVVLLAGKLALYSGALYLLVFRPVVSPLGVFAGVGGVTFVMVAGGLAAGPARTKEAA